MGKKESSPLERRRPPPEECSRTGDISLWIERKFLIDFERGSFSRGGTWKLIILSAAFRRRERQPSNRQVNRRLLLVHVKRFVPQNIEFVVYRRTTTPSHPRFTGINFRLSAINRPVYLGKFANQWKAGNIHDSIYNWAHCH